MGDQVVQGHGVVLDEFLDRPGTTLSEPPQRNSGQFVQQSPPDVGAEAQIDHMEPQRESHSQRGTQHQQHQKDESGMPQLRFIRAGQQLARQLDEDNKRGQLDHRDDRLQDAARDHLLLDRGQ
ncbi:Uncharacterised protein [Mycobacteroides abscessus subsp. abscessus]|nr:Uncharacterised protein [Mycobacteroides abscessus subsp. abscessus]